MEDLLLELDPICKGLQAQASADLVAKARSLVQEREFNRARELLVQAIQVDFTNRAARALLEEVNADLKRILIRPKVEKHVNAGREFLEEGRIQEAQLEAENALKLDSNFEPAEELLRQVQQEIGRAKLVSEWLQAAGDRLAEGMPEEAEAFLGKIHEIDPANRRVAKLQEQVLAEKATRQRRIHLLETMQRARTLWMQQKYEPCIDLLNSLQKEFGDEEEVQKSLVTAREDRAEQYKRQTLERARTLLAAGSYGECRPLLTGLLEEFPSDEEIPNLLDQLRKDEAEQRKQEALKEARNLLAARCYEDCLLLLASLRNEFPDETEIVRFVEAVHADQQAEKKEQGLKEARSLLASQRYDECRALLTGLQVEFPGDGEIPSLLHSLQEEQAEQRRWEGLSEARKLLASRQYAESLTLLGELRKQFPEDQEIPALANEVRKEQAEQLRLQGVSQARELLAARQFAESLALLNDLMKQYPGDDRIPALAEAVQKEQAEQQKLEGLAEARKLRVSRQYVESLALLSELKTQFPDDTQILALADEVRTEQAEQVKQQGISQAQKLLESNQFAECLALLNDLKKQYSDDDRIPALAEAAYKEQAAQERFEGLAETRKLRASRQFAESLVLLSELKKQYPDDTEIPALADEIRREQAEQAKQQGISQAQKLLASKQFAESLALLNDLSTQFPGDKQIAMLAEAVQREQAEQRKLQGLAEARKLRASKQFAESLALLNDLKKQFPNDQQIAILSEAVQKDQTEQSKLQGLAEARKFLASKQYAKSLSLLSELKTQFPDDKEIFRLADAVRKDQAEQQKQLDLANARRLRASKQYPESLAILGKLKTQFPDDKEIPRLAEAVQKDQAEQGRLQGLSEARNLLTSRRLEESFALLMGLRNEFPNEDDIARLLVTVEQERAEQQKQHRLTEARELLGSQLFDQALAVLDPLLAANPRDSGVLKLRALILEEREKVARSARLAHELQVLKKLVSDESHETAIAKAQDLLRDFANNADLVRLLEFARNRKEQIERERRLNQILEEVQKFISSNRLAEAIAAARHGLKSFEGDSDLKRLLQQAEAQRKKEVTRLQIQQQVREIKTRIHREEFSDAVRLAQDALSTLGPDTDLTQLLNSARVETQARDKKRGQGRMLEKVRELLEFGDVEGATLVLDQTIKNEELDDADPRVERLSKEIAAATRSKDQTLAPAAHESGAKEYAFLEGPPQIVAPEDQVPVEEQIAPSRSANQAGPSLRQPEMAPQEQIAPASAIPEVKIAAVTASQQTRPVPQTKPLPLVPLWKRPSMLAAELLGLILVVSMGTYFLHRSNSSQEVSHYTSQPAVTAPAKNLPETQQQKLMDAADKAIEQGDFKGAQAALEQAKNINGPLNSQIDQRLDGVEKGINDSATAAVLSQEEKLWSQATTNTQDGKFVEAQQAVREILALPPGGRRKGEAHQYLTEVIPRRQHEEQLFTQAQQAMNGKDSGSLRHAAGLFGEAAKLNGPRQPAAIKNQQEALAALANLNKASALSALADGARQDVKRGDFRSARQAAVQLQQSGGDLASISQEINDAEQVRFSQLDASLNQLKQRNEEGAVQSLRDLQPQLQALADGGGPTANDARRDAAGIPDAILGVQVRVTFAREETAYQQAIQRYRANTTDKSALDASRSDFQSIAKGGGHRAADAQKIVDEINAEVAVLNQPRINPPADEAPAVIAAVQRYADAFDQRDVDALRRVWPTMTPADYGKFKISFAGFSGIQLQVSNEKVELGSDGATAIVNADITRSYTPKGEKPLVSRDHSVFHLVKSKGAWVIKDLQ
jgi:hypothetical protein